MVQRFLSLTPVVKQMKTSSSLKQRVETANAVLDIIEKCSRIAGNLARLWPMGAAWICWKLLVMSSIPLPIILAIRLIQHLLR
jgi:hypothetical protein